MRHKAQHFIECFAVFVGLEPVPPQEFIDSQWQLVTSWQPVESHVAFDAAPIRFNGICAGTSVGIYEVLHMIDCLMNITQTLERTVGWPLIGVDGGPRSYKSLNYRDQGLGPSVTHQLDVTKFRRGIVQSEGIGMYFGKLRSFFRSTLLFCFAQNVRNSLNP